MPYIEFRNDLNVNKIRVLQSNIWHLTKGFHSVNVDGFK